MSDGPPSNKGGADEPPPLAAAAASNSSPGDATLVQALYAAESLIQLFGFDADAANQAVDAVGTDLTTCYNYILDQGLGDDKGGAIYPIDSCPHLDQHGQVLLHLLVDPLLGENQNPMLAPCCHHHSLKKKPPSGGLKGEDATSDNGTCPMGENWLCLECGDVYCSRYVNGHGLQHWKDTASTQGGDGHCIAVSLADLSVWCHVCSSYLRHERLTPLLKRLEALKFPTNGDDNVTSGANK
jgi:hypothetical protein